MKKSIAIYHNYIPKVGGIESAVYNLSKLLEAEGYHITIAYTSAESYESLFRYATACDKVIKIDPKMTSPIVADVCLIASNHDIPKEITAKRFLQWIHSDYDRYSLELKNIGKVEYVAVSKHVRDVIKKREDVDSTVIYNLLDPDFNRDEDKELRLVTNSRVSPEKGFGRMLKLAELLKENKVKFSWMVFGDNSHYPNEFEDWKRKFAHVEEVLFVGYKSDITIGLRHADYLVQLSDFEGCPYAVLEALRWKIPCLVTDWAGVDELIEDGKNGYILPQHMNLDCAYVDKIVNNIPKVKEKDLSTIKDWIKLIEDKQ
jgi:glycosyltransferase involved in cell wall biosynthesis